MCKILVRFGIRLLSQMINSEVLLLNSFLFMLLMIILCIFIDQIYLMLPLFTDCKFNLKTK